MSRSDLLQDRVALVTGGSRGIGRAIAQAFADAGGLVALVARTTAELEQARAALVARGAKVAIVRGDVADRAFCFDAVRQVERHFGRIDILVNNAGVQGPIGPFEELAGDEVAYTVAVDFLAAVWLSQAVAPQMKARRDGVIVNLSGGGATGPRERFTPYGAAKAALVRFTETVAAELAPFGVRVNAVAPGAVNTRMLEEVERAGERAGAKALEEARRQRETGGTPPELVAELVVFLAAESGRPITGKLISAVWDDWRGLREGTFQISNPEWFTLRRLTPATTPPARAARDAAISTG